VLTRRLLSTAVALLWLGTGTASADGVRAGFVAPAGAAQVTSERTTCESSPAAFARVTELRGSPAVDWCAGITVGSATHGPAWTADLELPLGIRLAATALPSCGSAACTSPVVGTLTATSTTALGQLRETGTVVATGSSQLVATFAQAGVGAPIQTARLELLSGPYGGQVLRISSWPTSRDTEAGTLLTPLQSLTLRLLGGGTASALKALPRCDIRHQTSLILRPEGLAGPTTAFSDAYALSGCDGSTTAEPLHTVASLPSALTPFFATQARSRPARGRGIGWLRAILVPEPAPGTDVVATLRTPDTRLRRIRGSGADSADITLSVHPRAPITAQSRLTVRSAVSGGHSTTERFRFAVVGGALRAHRLP
jgi:hypothetical protein